MRTITCKRCNKEFETNKKNICYCSAVCALESIKDKKRAWYKKNPGYNKKYYESHIKKPS